MDVRTLKQRSLNNTELSSFRNGCRDRELLRCIHAVLHKSQIQRTYLHRLHGESWAQDRAAQRRAAPRGSQEDQWKRTVVWPKVTALYYTMSTNHTISYIFCAFSLSFQGDGPHNTWLCLRYCCPSCKYSCHVTTIFSTKVNNIKSDFIPFKTLRVRSIYVKCLFLWEQTTLKNGRNLRENGGGGIRLPGWTESKFPLPLYTGVNLRETNTGTEWTA